MKTRRVSEAPRALRGFRILTCLLVHGNSRERLEREVVSALLVNPQLPEPSHPGKEEREEGAWEGGECVLEKGGVSTLT